jgi:hypothetical protein
LPACRERGLKLGSSDNPVLGPLARGNGVDRSYTVGAALPSQPGRADESVKVE